MARISWDDIEDKNFETGVDRGVLYHQNGRGVPWNGLISIQENGNIQAAPIIYDGVKINDIVGSKSFTGTLRAFTYPDEFDPYVGLVEDSAGFLIAEQTPARFHLSYRTLLGNQNDGVDYGYRLHILYDVLAIPATKSYRTLGLDITPLELEWAISTIPRELSGFKPTSHLIVDSRKVPPWFLADVEEVLYGTQDKDAFLPSLESLASYIRGWDRIVIIDPGDGTWTAATLLDDAIVDLGNGEFQINGANVTYLDAETYEISSTERDEGELWQQ